MAVNVMSDFLAVEFRSGQLCIYISDPDAPKPLVAINAETLRQFGRFPDAAKFIGERIALLMPSVRALFPEPLYTEEEQRIALERHAKP